MNNKLFAEKNNSDSKRERIEKKRIIKGEE